MTGRSITHRWAIVLTPFWALLGPRGSQKCPNSAKKGGRNLAQGWVVDRLVNHPALAAAHVVKVTTQVVSHCFFFCRGVLPCWYLRICGQAILGSVRGWFGYDRCIPQECEHDVFPVDGGCVGVFALNVENWRTICNPFELISLFLRSLGYVHKQLEGGKGVFL